MSDYLNYDLHRKRIIRVVDVLEGLRGIYLEDCEAEFDSVRIVHPEFQDLNNPFPLQSEMLQGEHPPHEHQQVSLKIKLLLVPLLQFLHSYVSLFDTVQIGGRAEDAIEAAE